MAFIKWLSDRYQVQHYHDPCKEKENSKKTFFHTQRPVILVAHVVTLFLINFFFLTQPGSGWLIRLAKWNDYMIRYWRMQILWIVITLSHLRALHYALRETFLKVTNIKLNCQTAPKQALGARWFQITVTCVKERIVGREKKSGGGGVR